MRWRTRSGIAAWAAAVVVGGVAAGDARAEPYLYVTQQSGSSVPGQIAQYDATAPGALTALAPLEVTGGVEPYAAVVHPDGRALYIVNAGMGATPSVSQFTIASDGRLTAKAPATVLVGTGGSTVTFALAISPDGRHVYVGDDTFIRRYDVTNGGPDDGELTPAGPTSLTGLGSVPNSLAVSPDGKSLYVALQASSRIAQFDVAADGTLTLKSTPTLDVPGVMAVATSPDGSSVYAAATGGLHHFAADGDGDLTAQGSTPLGGTLASRSLVVAPDGDALFVAINDSTGNDDVQSFALDASGAPTGATSRVDTSSANLVDIALAPSGGTLYAVSQGTTHVIDRYTRITAAGQLSRQEAVTTPRSFIGGLTLTPVADLRVSASGGSGTESGLVSYTVTAHNDGPTSVPNAQTSLALPAETTFISSTSSQGSCTGTTCDLGVIRSGESATATITARALQAGTWTANASVNQGPWDPDTSNQTASAAATVTTEPRAVTGAASDVTSTAATVNGVVDPTGGTTTYHFEYGTTTAYGSTTPTATLESTTAAGAVSSTIAGLQPATEYHYRVVAVQGGVTVNGADRTFTTSPTQPRPAEPVVITREVQVPVDRRLAPRSLSVSVSPRSDRAWPFHFRVRGKLALPSDVARDDGCTGTVTVALQSGKRTVASRRVSLSERCSFDARLALGKSFRTRRGSLRAVVRFAGNGALTPLETRRAAVRFGR